MSIKISQLPNLTTASLITISNASLPIVGNLGANLVTYQTTIGNVKTFVETGNLNVTGSINGNLTSTFANLIITGNLNVQGTTTTTSSQNLSTNSSIIDLHTFDSNLSPWTSDDGRDIGLRFFWYKGASAGTAALVWENSNSFLTWYGSGVANTNIGAISGTLGTMQLGELIVSNNTPATANATGALQVSGGISTGGNIWVGENIVSTGNFTSTGNITSTGAATVSSLQVNNASTVGTTLVVGSSTTLNSLAVNTFATVGTTLVTSGNTTVANLTVNSSSTIGTTLRAAGGIQNTPIGNVTASTGQFTTASATGNLTGSGLSINNTATIGSTLGVTGNINGSGATLSGSIVTTGPGQNLGGLQATPIGNASPSTANLTSFTVTGISYHNGNVITNNILPFGNANANIGSSTLQYNTIFALATSSLYADLAENYEADNKYEPGTVVVFGGSAEITTSSTYADTRVAGVISTNPAYLMNNGSTTGLPVALRGKVPVKIVGPVQKGDLLVTSTTPGAVTSVGSFSSGYNPLAVIAKSLEDDASEELRTIYAVIV